MNPPYPRDAPTARRRSVPPPPERQEETSIQAVRRYAVHAEIGAGTLSTVHLGRLHGPEKFARTVVVKRLRPQYAKDSECVSLLLEGARLAAGVRHTNVAATLDLVTGDELLVVAEYVHGESLAALLRTARGRGVQAPLPVVSGVVVGVLRGLHAVHAARAAGQAPGGTSARRRGLAPQDIVVGTDGVARLVDVAGRPGTGEPNGQEREADPIVSLLTENGLPDVFGASVILWEALAGRALLPRTTAGFELPSRYRPEVDAAVDAVVAKGLAQAPAPHFATAEEMALALEAVLPPATPSQIGAWVVSLARETLEERDRLLAKLEDMTQGAPSVRPPADTIPTDAIPVEPTVVVHVGTLPRSEVVTRRTRARPSSFPTQRGIGPVVPVEEDRPIEPGAIVGLPISSARRAVLAAGIAGAALLVAIGARVIVGPAATGSAGSVPIAATTAAVTLPPTTAAPPVPAAISAATGEAAPVAPVAIPAATGILPAPAVTVAAPAQRGAAAVARAPSPPPRMVPPTDSSTPPTAVRAAVPASAVSAVSAPAASGHKARRAPQLTRDDVL